MVLSRSGTNSMKSLVLDIVERVTIAANRIDIWLNRAKIAAALEAGGGNQRPDIDPITLSIEAKLRRAGKGKRLVTGTMLAPIPR
jgi:site-specific DNA recombinase